MKKISFALLLCATLIFSSAAPAIAAPTATAATITAEQALATARTYVPTDSTHLKTKTENNRYEVHLYSQERQETYEVDISATTGKLIAFDSDAANDYGAPSTTLSEAEAKKAVTNEIANVNSISMHTEWDDGLAEYVVTFSAKTCYGKYYVHPQTGRVLDRDITASAHASTGTTTQAPAQSGTATYLTRDRIRDLALREFSGGRITDIDFDYDYGVAVYEVEVYTAAGLERDLYFDAITGKLLAGSDTGSSTQTTTNDGYISMERAKQIALARAPAGATVWSCEFDRDDGRALYEGELRNGRWEYEFEIDATTGTILKWDEDYDD